MPSTPISAEIIVQVWPILAYLTPVIALLAVALYRLYRVEKERKEDKIQFEKEQKEKEEKIEKKFQEIKGNLFRLDGELIYATAVETTLEFNRIEARLDVADAHCKRIDSVEKDVNRVQDQQQKNMDKNLTVSVHDLGCKLARTELKDWFREEIKQTKRDLLEGNIGTRRKDD